MTIKQNNDYPVVLGLLIAANVVAVVGFVWEYSLLGVIFVYIGLSGLLCGVLALMWLTLVLVEYILGD